MRRGLARPKAKISISLRPNNRKCVCEHVWHDTNVDRKKLLTGFEWLFFIYSLYALLSALFPPSAQHIYWSAFAFFCVLSVLASMIDNWTPNNVTEYEATPFIFCRDGVWLHSLPPRHIERHKTRWTGGHERICSISPLAPSKKFLYFYLWCTFFTPPTPPASSTATWIRIAFLSFSWVLLRIHYSCNSLLLSLFIYLQARLKLKIIKRTFGRDQLAQISHVSSLDFLLARRKWYTEWHRVPSINAILSSSIPVISHFTTFLFVLSSHSTASRQSEGKKHHYKRHDDDNSRKTRTK